MLLGILDSEIKHVWRLRGCRYRVGEEIEAERERETER